MAEYKLNLNNKTKDFLELSREYGFINMYLDEGIENFDDRKAIAKEIEGVIGFLKKGDRVQVILPSLSPIQLAIYTYILKKTGNFPRVWYYRFSRKFQEIELLPPWDFFNLG